MILVSAGHTRKKPGACFEEFCEHEEAVRWRDALVARMNGAAAAVPVGSLKRKVEFVNKYEGAEMALEVHFNSAVDADGNQVGAGCETLYYPGSTEGRQWASTIQGALAGVFAPDRGVKEGWDRADAPGVEDYPGDEEGDERPLYFLAKTKIPALIIEPEFIHKEQVIRASREAACAELARVILAARRRR